MTHTIVIGAGVSGLATAALLAREGHRVTVLERGDLVGGRAGTLEDGGFRWDTGPSWYLMPRVYDHFFRLLGTSAEAELDLVDLDPGYRVFAEPDGATPVVPFDIPRGRERVRAAFEAREPGSGAVLDAYLASAEHATQLAESSFLYNPFTDLRSLVRPDIVRELPELVPLLAGSLESYVARRFRDPVLRQVLGYPAVFLGTTPAEAPALFHLMSALDLGTGVSYPRGGFAGVVERIAALATAAGADIRTGADVERIRTARAGRRARATGVVWRDADGVRHAMDADLVVSTADLHHTETELLDPADRSRTPGWWRRRDPGPGAALAMLGVEGELPELPHHSLFFTRDWERNFRAVFRERRIPTPASLYVCKPSASDPDVAPPGHENLFLLIPIPADPGLGDAAIDGAVDAGIATVSDWAGIPDLAERIVVRHTRGPRDFARDLNAWQGGMLGPGHTLGESAMFRPQHVSRKVAGLYVAGGSVAPGIGVPMCLISAEIVVKRIRNDRTAGPLPTPLERA